ncbi:NADH-dependent flavin oxidoreductase [Lactiplantibacillus garii]|uniref:NADH-dependent flavin oxidoreductase n=1 Tax=Lactiplantibacillus garii TaxID=2306423 RepID=A0A426DA33_9LACO|nr:NADH-dependent flavin oxidoreductase [Lactiplantibacillus garii]RRK11460.1 NADH-dependent flavin oxidoreductase [Lactiplantibacillus garii]
MKQKYLPLFEPYELNNGVSIKNRLVVAPLTIYDSGTNGELTESARNFWRDRFNGFGTFVMPFTNVDPSGIGFESPDAFSDNQLPTLREYVQLAHGQGAKIIMQLGHAGYKARPDMTRGFNVLAPDGTVRRRARTMNEGQIQKMIAAFANAARLGIKAGMDGVEIQGANGWLVEQFFSPATNHRSDHWGGSFQKRLNFLMAIIDAVDAVRRRYHRPNFIIGYRFSPERPRDGFSMQDSLALIDALVQKPLQYLHVSLLSFYSRPRRGADRQQTRMQIFHQRIGGKLPLIGVGSLYTGNQILSAYQTGWAEFIAVGRSVMLNPNLVQLIQSGRDDEIETTFNWQHVQRYRYTPAMLQAKREKLDLAYRTPHRITLRR